MTEPLVKYEIDKQEVYEFHRAVSRYIEGRKIPVEKATRDEMRLWAKYAIALTPPHKGKGQGRVRFKEVGGYATGVAGDLQARTVGQRRVAEDVPRALGYIPWYVEQGWFDENKPFGRRIVKLMEQNKPLAIQEMFKNSRGLRFGGARSKHIVPKEQHQRLRTKRGGVPKNVGRLQFFTMNHSGVKDYIKSRKDNVGMAKGGWVEAIKKAGGSAARWIDKHRKEGTAKDDLKDPKDPSFYMSNKSPWAENPERAIRTLNTVFKRRAQNIAEKLEKAHVRAMQKKLERLKK